MITYDLVWGLDYLRGGAEKVCGVKYGRRDELSIDLILISSFLMWCALRVNWAMPASDFYYTIIRLMRF